MIFLGRMWATANVLLALFFGVAAKHASRSAAANPWPTAVLCAASAWYATTALHWTIKTAIREAAKKETL